MNFSDIKVGQILQYVFSSTGYTGTICRVVDIDSSLFTVEIITTGKAGLKTWGNNKITGTFLGSDAYKFDLFQGTTENLETKLIKKIKDLDSRWTLQQKAKGKDYALLRL